MKSIKFLYAVLPASILLLVPTSALGEPPITAGALDQYLQSKNSPIAGNGGSLVAEGLQYNVDPRLVVSIAGQESMFGTDLHKGAFNAWGWLWNKTNPDDSYFSSWEEGIHNVTKYLRKSYFDPLLKNSVKPTIETVGGIYCVVQVDPNCIHWVPNVTQFYHVDLGGDLGDLGFKGSAPPTLPSFAPKFDRPTGTEPLGLAVADFDGDGEMDIAVTIYNNGVGDHLTIFRNNDSTTGNLKFDVPVDFPTGRGPEGIAAGDLDKDGKIDLVTVNPGNSSITVLRNHSSRGFLDFQPVPLSLPSPPTPHRVVIKDFDGDGLPDLIVTSNNGRLVSVFHHGPDPNTISFDYRTDFGTGDFLNELAVTDLDNNMKPEILLPLPSGLMVFQNTSTQGNVQASALPPFAAGAGPNGIATGDLNNDQLPDVLVTVSGGVTLFQNQSTTGIFRLPRTDVATGTNPGAVGIGDLDHDGFLDAVVSNPSDNTLTVLHNTTGAMGAPIALTPLQTPLGTGMNPINLVLEDIDHDGWLDIVVANHDAGTISVILNTTGHP